MQSYLRLVGLLEKQKQNKKWILFQVPDTPYHISEYAVSNMLNKKSNTASIGHTPYHISEYAV